ncbi:MAG: FAD-dependent oxidoreductase [Candidatus Coprovivens sp.]
MEIKSIWTKDIHLKEVNSLKDNIDVDVLIIGGGLTGISCAYYLKDNNLKIAVVEKNNVGMGVTSRTTGKINYLQETIYSDLEERYSYEVAKRYYESQVLAIDEFKRIIKNEEINCNFEQVKSYIFTNKSSEVDNIKLEENILESFGVEVNRYTFMDNDLKCKYAISVNDTYTYHPLKFLYSLRNIIESQGINIYEKTEIIEIVKKSDSYICYTKDNKIVAKKVIIACHYPFFLKPYMMPLKVYTEKSYIVVGKTNDYKRESLITTSMPVKSIRYFGNKYVFYLGNSHNICNKLNEVENFNNTLREAQMLGIKAEYIWSNDDMMSIDRIPYIGRLEKDNENLLIGTAYSTWGMTNGLLAGYILSNMVNGKRTDYDDIFDPLRVCSLDCFLNMGSSIKSFIQNKVVKNKEWYSNRIKYETRNGKKVAVYIDDNKEYVVLSNCPHMGCTLIFNEIEKTWDCPCHASKFDLNGKCIKGPSSYDISYREES